MKTKHYKLWLNVEVVDEDGRQLESNLDLPFSATATCMTEDKILSVAAALHEIGQVITAHGKQTA